LHKYADLAFAGNAAGAVALKAAGQLLGLFNVSPEEWFRGGLNGGSETREINRLLREREDARETKDYAKADRRRKELLDRHGVVVEDGPQGTIWRYVAKSK